MSIPFRIGSGNTGVSRAAKAILGRFHHNNLVGTTYEAMGSQANFTALLAFTLTNNFIRGITKPGLHSQSEGLSLPDEALGFVPTFWVGQQEDQAYQVLKALRFSLGRVPLPSPSEVWLPSKEVRSDVIRVTQFMEYSKVQMLVKGMWAHEKRDNVKLVAKGGDQVYTALKSLAQAYYEVGRFKGKEHDPLSPSHRLRPFAVVPTNHRVPHTEKLYVQFTLVPLENQIQVDSCKGPQEFFEKYSKPERRRDAEEEEEFEEEPSRRVGGAVVFTGGANDGRKPPPPPTRRN